MVMAYEVSKRRTSKAMTGRRTQRQKRQAPPVFEGLRGTVNIAHRGGAALAPENTLYAFHQAVTRYRCQVIETDVHLLSDGEVVLFHDGVLERTTDGHGPIAAKTYPEVSALDAAYHFVPAGLSDPVLRGQGIQVPRLIDALNAFPTTRFNIDLKATDPLLVRAVAKILKQQDALDRVCIGSEYDGVAEQLHAELPEATLFFPRAALISWVMGALSGQPAPSLSAFSVLEMPAKFRGVELVTDRLLECAETQGLWVNVWTIDDPAEMRRFIDLGIDGIMTDRPDLLHDLLSV